MLQNTVAGILELDIIKALEELYKAKQGIHHRDMTYDSYLELLVSCAEDFDAATACHSQTNLCNRQLF